MAEQDLTVTGHLEELRRRIITALAALFGAAILCLPFASAILGILKLPARGALEKLVYFSPEEALLIYMRISIIAGIVISFPVLAYQAWAFTAPALGTNFRKYTVYFIVASIAAFAAGCAFAYFALLPAALNLLLTIGRSELEPVISATRYISFVTGFILACGAVFEMPVVAFFLGRTGVISAGLMRRKFKYAFVIIIIAAAIITPTGDAFNMMLLALPMLALYELSIWVVFFASKRGMGNVQ
jgi:sec-independent protein translocase protein TatC